MKYRVNATWTEPAAPGLYTSRWSDEPAPDITYAKVLGPYDTRAEANRAAIHFRQTNPTATIDITTDEAHANGKHERDDATDRAKAAAIAALRAH